MPLLYLLSSIICTAKFGLEELFFLHKLYRNIYVCIYLYITQHTHTRMLSIRSSNFFSNVHHVWTLVQEKYFWPQRSLQQEKCISYFLSEIQCCCIWKGTVLVNLSMDWPYIIAGDIMYCLWILVFKESSSQIDGFLSATCAIEICRCSHIFFVTCTNGMKMKDIHGENAKLAWTLLQNHNLFGVIGSNPHAY